jgi:hypothetical protein
MTKRKKQKTEENTKTKAKDRRQNTKQRQKKKESTSLNDGQTTSTIMPHSTYKVLIFEHKIFDFHVNLQACTRSNIIGINDLV